MLLSLLSRERSLDPNVLCELCRQKLHECGVRIVRGTASRSMLERYDSVISAVYGNPNLLQEPSRQQDHHLSLCEMMMVELPDHYAGVSAMVVYGPFMTIDVLGSSGSHVLYHATHGVHHVTVARFANEPAAYRPFMYRFTAARQLDALTRAPLALRDARRYFEGIDRARHVASNFVVRVQAPGDVRDAIRRTTIQQIRPRWFSITASKLSACVSIADKMVELVRVRRRRDGFATLSFPD